MNFTIEDETIKATIKCNASFSCLKSDAHNLCKIERVISDKIHFINNKSRTTCNYITYFGDSIICSCPVRKEIYNRHKT
ncbi:MAG: hypothetical protein V1874_16295 [Spirochaetota bacterium]